MQNIKTISYLVIGLDTENVTSAGLASGLSL